MIISVDPGKKKAGIAVFEDGELTLAFLAKGVDWYDTALRANTRVREGRPMGALGLGTVAVIERMQVYGSVQAQKNGNDLIDCAMMAGAFVAMLRSKEKHKEYLPREWNGSVPKEITRKRVKKRLSEEELARFESKAHDVYDAVGIGLKYLGRL